MEKCKTKYIHILHSEIKFSTNLIKMILNPDNEFNVDEHLFIVSSDEVFNNLKQYNVKIINFTEGSDAYLIINQYGDRCDWIFLHGIFHRYMIHKVKKQFRGKIIWRTWGHDSCLGYNEIIKKNIFDGLLKVTYNYFIYRRVVNSFHEVGIANSVDVISLKLAKINLPQILLPYPSHISFDYNQLLSEEKSHNSLKVIIGHSGHAADRHFHIIDIIKKYKGCNVVFYFMLSYGDQDYITRVKKYAQEELGEQAIIIDEFMDYKKYAEFLNKIDISILPGRYSYALGNIALLLRLQKTIYLDGNGILSKAFKNENIPFIDIQNINNMEFADFSQTLNYECNSNWSLISHPYEDNVLAWKKCLNELDNEMNFKLGLKQ